MRSMVAFLPILGLKKLKNINSGVFRTLCSHIISDQKGASLASSHKIQESVISSARLISGNLSRHQANLTDQGNLTDIIVCLVVLLLPWASIPNSLK
jgi:hypothetical protein